MEEADMDVVVLQLCGHQWPDGGDHWWASARLRQGDAGAREGSDTPAATS